MWSSLLTKTLATAGSGTFFGEHALPHLKALSENMVLTLSQKVSKVIAQEFSPPSYRHPDPFE